MLLVIAGSVKSGYEWAKGEEAQRDLVRAEKIIVRQKIVEVEVPKIVEKVVTRTLTVEKEVERVVEKIVTIPADCDASELGLFLTAAANGFDPSRPPDGFVGAYGCREVLAATLHDLRAGWINTTRYDALKDWVKVTR